MIVNSGIGGKQKTIIIIGVQRGGTSMVAGTVRELGVNLGKNLGNNHEDPEFLTKDVGRIIETIKKRNKDNDVWGWKVPHTSEYISDILCDIRNPHLIIVFRNLISMTESQMKRSSATFSDAFKFSLSRLNQISGLIPVVHAPLMLVGYEKGVEDPEVLVNEICSFLDINPSDDARRRAVEMINPEVGYRRTSAEAWHYTVSKAEMFDRASLISFSGVRRDNNIVRFEGNIQKSNEVSFIEFDQVNSNKIALSVNRDRDPDFIRISVDVGGGYSSNMSDKIPLYRGGNIITIDAPAIKGIRVYPQFDGIWSNTKLFRVFYLSSSDY